MKLALFMVLIIAPALIGSYVDDVTLKTKEKSLFFEYVTGWIVMLAVFQLLAIPFTILQRSLTEIVVVFSIFLAVAGIIAFVHIVRNNLKNIFCVNEKWHLYIIPILLILFQIAVSVIYNPEYVYSGDDTTYITMANDMNETDKIYLTDYLTGEECSLGDVSPKYTLTSYLIFTAYLARISGLHVLFVCKTILPAVVIIMAYGIWMSMAKQLFGRNSEKVAIFMILLSVLNLFCGFSNYTLTFRLLVCSWQGKAILAVVALPYLFLIAWKIFLKDCQKSEMFILAAAMLAASAGSVFGNGLAVMMLLLIAFICALYTEKFSKMLYAGICCIPNLIFLLIYMRYGNILTWFGV